MHQFYLQCGTDLYGVLLNQVSAWFLKIAFVWEGASGISGTEWWNGVTQ